MYFFDLQEDGPKTGGRGGGGLISGSLRYCSPLSTECFLAIVVMHSTHYLSVDGKLKREL